MQPFKTFLGALALAASAVASSNPVYFTSAPTKVEPSKAVKLAWKAPQIDNPVLITLMKGPMHDLQPVSYVSTTATGGSYFWTPPANLAPATDYAFEIKQNDNVNWWGPVTIEASNGHGQSNDIATSTANAMASVTAMPPPPANSTVSHPPPPFNGAGAGASLRIPTACGLAFVAALALAL